MDQWLYSISDHCFDDHTNYRQNCYSSIVDGIVLLPLFLNIGDNSPIFRTSGISPSKNILFKICVRTVIIFSPACIICSIVKL